MEEDVERALSGNEKRENKFNFSNLNAKKFMCGKLNIYVSCIFILNVSIGDEKALCQMLWRDINLGKKKLLF